MISHFINTLDKYLSTPKKVIIIPHKNPDGDALGSCLALAHFLNNKKHTATIISPNEYPLFLKWLPGEESIVSFSDNHSKAIELIKTVDIIFTLDFNNLLRIGNLATAIANVKAKFVMIDHHQSPDEYADLMYSDTSMSSTCEMVYNILKALDESAITPDIATCLYTGIMTDTGSFRYPSTTANTHRAIAHLIDCGANGTSIHQNTFDTSSFNRVKLLGKCITNLKKIEGLPVVYMTLSQSELNRHNYKKGDTEGFVNFGLSLLGIVVSVIMIENENEGKIKISFRSKGSFSVNDLAKTHFSGGGHINAAGGMSIMTMEKTVSKFITTIRSYSDQLVDHA